MEYCIEARALKPSLRREITKQMTLHHAHAHSQTQAVMEDLIFETETHAGPGGAAVGGVVDDFLIDDLLDFPEKEVNEEEEEKDSASEFSLENDDHENGTSAVTGDVDADDFFSDAGLAVPQDDLADLEWVSRFVDDSTPEFPPLYPTTNTRKHQPGLKPSGPAGSGSLPVQLFNQPLHMNNNNNNHSVVVIPAKPRTKRQRVGRVWTIGSNSTSDNSSTTTTTTSTTSSITSSSSNPVQFGFGKPVVKRQKTNLESVVGESVVGRRCSHCQVQKTPQWRAGPEGAKTLCNACGVRFKSGRLYPEYRPACSPTFRGDVHSNSHRKVLEMRKKKDVGVGSTSGLAVQSF